jgi:UDP-N-acetylglucosamine--N-acetylmuramyl-(pentapeptide) pyrophosphoryl-undecaprenol N-acetylglucosamine transferase
LIWAATPRAVDERLLSQFGERYVRQAVQPLVKSFGKLWGFWRGWRDSCQYWAEYFAQRRVDAVVALGGYAAGPAAYVAAKRKIPVALLNPDALPGRANRFLLKRADVIATQWAFGEELSRGLAGRVKVLGCPIRKELAGITREQGAARLGVDGCMKTLVVTGASLGAKTINDALVLMLEDEGMRGVFENRPEGKVTDGKMGNWQIIHLTGMDQAEAVRGAYAKFPQVRVKVMDYCDDMGSLWAVADLAIARAGASTCAELTACGVPAILLPYPFHKDMHQRANAMELVKAGAGVIVEDAKDARANAGAIQKVLKTLLYDDANRREMAMAARRVGKPEAADAIAGEILCRIGPSSR